MITFTISLGNLQAQFKNILLDSTINKSGYYPTEPSIAINRKNPNNVVAGTSVDNVYKSDDGGATFQKSRLRSPHGIWGNPTVVSDFSGNFYYFHLSDPTGKNWESDETLDRIVGQKSKDGGSSWDAGESIGLNPPKDQSKQWAVSDRKGNLYVSWTEFDQYGGSDPNCTSKIMFSKSPNGSRWSKPIVLSQIPGDCSDDDQTTEGAVPAVTNDGKVFVAWANQGIIFLDRSFDGGDTWLTNDIAVAEQAGGWKMDIPGMQRAVGKPILACDNTTKSNFSGALYLVWADTRNGEDNADIWFTRSVNYGDNWTHPMLIHSDRSEKHQFMPWLTVDPTNGYIYVVYYDRRDHEDNQTDVYLSYSVDNGVNFKDVKISEQPFIPHEDIFFGDYINITAYKGKIIPIWTRIDGGKTSIWMAVINHDELDKKK